MSISLAWTFPTINTVDSLDGITNAVISIIWQCTATDSGTGQTYSMSGLVGIDPPVAYSGLTFDSTSTLVFATVVQSDVETEASNILTDKLASSPIVPMDPPF